MIVRTTVFFFVTLLLPTLAMAKPTIEFVRETCAGASGLLAATNVCAVTDVKTGASRYEVVVAVGVFADTQVTGVGFEGSSALVARVTIPVGEAANAEAAGDAAIELVNGSAPGRVVLRSSAPRCEQSAPKFAEAVELIRSLTEAARVPENMCRP